MGGTKKVHARQHTRERLKERYGLDMTNEEYDALIEEAVDDPENIVAYRDDGTTIHKVKHRGEDVVVALNQSGTLILTAYPPDAHLFTLIPGFEL